MRGQIPARKSNAAMVQVGEQPLDERPNDVRDAAAFLGCSVSHLNKLRCTGEGPPYIKLGARVLYETSDLRAYRASRKRRSTSEAA